MELLPGSIAIRLDLGIALHTLWRLEEALSIIETALQIDPQHAIAHNNRGLILRDLGRLEEAEAALRCALASDGGYHDARANLALILTEQCRLEEAESELAKVIAANPDHVNARWHRAIVHLLRGNFAGAWPDYESRLKRFDAYTRPYRYPRWDGRILDEGALLIYAEQGLGDEILFASCFDDAIARTKGCIIECEPRLQPLFSRSFPRARVVGSKLQQFPDWLTEGVHIAAQIPAGSLPGIFRNRLEDFPAHRGYLVADPGRVAAWQERLAALGPGLKVGIAWTGGTFKTRRAIRSLTLEQLVPVLCTSSVHFVSLQYVDSSSEIAEIRSRYGIQIQQWPEAVADYEETAALVSALDLVISVTTAVVHLAGALGNQAWVMVPASPEWRYLQKGETMPWYPSVRLFRQQQPGDWTSVVQNVRVALEEIRTSRCERRQYPAVGYGNQNRSHGQGHHCCSKD